MNEAHEKTRLRQLEDAAAHWEHKYANARQYNRNLEERNQKLEAALRKYGNHSRTCDSFEDGNCRCGLSDILDARATAETKGEQG